MSWTLPLNAVDRGSLQSVGGKGANLGELTRAGFDVPPGFCVTTDSYASFVEENGLDKVVDEALAGLDVQDGAALARAGETIRLAFSRQSVSDEIAQAIRQALFQLGEVAVAVRSSATAEDLPEASFAGQQDTYLNIVGAEAVIDATRRCWASLWTDRAIAYRSRNGIAHGAVRLACVVQTLIPAQAAGVSFTANPVSGSRLEMVIDASVGLGEAIVSGLVTPDSYLIRKTGKITEQHQALEIIDRKIGEKSVSIEPVAGGGTVHRELANDERFAPVLSDEAILEVARLGEAVETYYGSPQDIEWAFAAGKLYILQSRPITSLFPLPYADPYGEFRVLICLSTAQGLIEPITPLGLSVFQTLLPLALGAIQRRTWERPPIIAVAGRIYLDFTGALRTELGRSLGHIFLGQVDPVAWGALEVVLPEPRLAPAPDTGLTLLRRGLPRILRASWPAPKRVFEYLRRPARVGEVIQNDLRPMIQSLADDLEAPGPLPERIAQVRPTLSRFGRVFIPNMIPAVAAAVGSTVQLGNLAERWNLDQKDVMALRQGVPNNPTTQMDLDLWATAKRIIVDPTASAHLLAHSPERLGKDYRAGTLPATAQVAMAEFLETYGHRAIREIDLGVPRWSEDPSYLFGVLQGYLGHDADGVAPDEHFAALAAGAEEAKERLLRATRRQMLGAHKARVVGFLADRIRNLLGYREAPKFYAVKMFSHLRRHYQGIGDELAERGEIDRAEDVFFLTMPEIDERARTGRLSPDVRRTIAERRVSYTREMSRNRLPRVLTSEGLAIYARRQSAGSAAISGAGVSPGIVRGKVRIVRDPIGAKLERGEILVAPSTDPAWTPLFLTAGGLVMEAGGMMSHGAVVAREYGIPAVVGAVDATHILKDGQEIFVDGSAGTVTLA